MVDKKKIKSEKAKTLLQDFAALDHTDPSFAQILMSQVMELEIKLNEQKSQIQELERDALSDGLTGLSNRRLLEDEVRKFLASAKRYKREYGLLFVDIDTFKAVNDKHGHLAGDFALKHVANLLRQNVRLMDVVARLSGDEFCILLHEIKDLEDVKKRGDYLKKLVDETPLTFNEKVIQVTISVGHAIFGANDTFETVMEKADSSMYSNKGKTKKA